MNRYYNTNPSKDLSYSSLALDEQVRGWKRVGDAGVNEQYTHHARCLHSCLTGVSSTADTPNAGYPAQNRSQHAHKIGDSARFRPTPVNGNIASVAPEAQDADLRQSLPRHMQ